MALHEQSIGASDEWYTPPHIFDAMQCSFDADVASPGQDKTPWIPAAEYLVMSSLEEDWRGFVWMNAPFGGRNALVPWLRKFVEHGNGVCLVPDRTSAPWWQEFAPKMELVLFATPKIRFISGEGKPNRSPAQGTCLMSIGQRGRWALCRAAVNGLGFLMKPAN